MQINYCRWSPTLGALEGLAEDVWGTPVYDPGRNVDAPCVFFGLYGLPDFYALWRHRGKKYILWAGTDIIHFTNGYWLEDGGGIKLERKSLAEWINKHCESWCENRVEANALMEVGIHAQVCPSFMGDKDKFEVSFKPGNKLYCSVSGDNFQQYGWHRLPILAAENPDIEFHLYGNSKYPFAYNLSALVPKNIITHGRVPKEQMNEEISQMQGGLRLTEFDGFSEITAKSVLMGQWPVSLIEYPHVLKVSEISEILKKKKPNTEGREYYRKIINNYPWIQRSK